MVIFAAPCCATEHDPVGGSIRSSTKSLGIDKRFEVVNRMAIDTLPILRQQPSHLTQNVRCKMFNLDERQDQESCIVGKKADVLAPRLGRPTDEPVTRPEMARGGRPCQAGNRTILRVDEELEVFSDRLRIPKIVVALNEAVEERFFPRTPHLAELERANSRQAGLEGCCSHERWGWLPALRRSLPQGVVRNKPYLRQLDVAPAMEFQHEPPAHHVAQRAVRLPPVPGLAQLL